MTVYQWWLYLDAAAHRHPRLYPQRVRSMLCRKVGHQEWLA